MDEVTRAYYELRFERDYLLKRGNEFQDFFATIMEKRHPGDFMRVRPWGRTGDQKNDGYLRPHRTLFAVYAPNEMSASEAIAKIDEDFTGALPHWQEWFDNWVFVHNSRQGLGPAVTRKLLELHDANNPPAVGHWGFEELRRAVFEISTSDIASLLGPAPSSGEAARIGFDDLKEVVDSIAERPAAAQGEIRPVPREKLAANALSESAAILLKSGMTKADLVGKYFRKWHDPALGDRIAQAFTAKYVSLRESGLTPDQVLVQLQEFAGGMQRGSPRREIAVLAVLAYLFEKCDIFEAPRESRS
ncbi:MAG: ABC-three component system protein [Planctomycetota bacterium]